MPTSESPKRRVAAASSVGALMTLADVARRTRLSRAQIDRLRDSGRLPATKDPKRRCWVYALADVEKLAQERTRQAAPATLLPDDGELAARIFRRLSEGADPIAIVVDDQVSPAALDVYRERFAAYRAQVVYTVEGPMRTLLDRLAVQSDRPTAQELLDCFERHVAEQRTRYAQERARIEAAHADERARLETDVKSLTDQLRKSTAALAEAGERIRAQQNEIEQLGQLGLAAAAKVAELQSQLAARSPAPPTETPPEPGPSDPNVS